MRTHRFSLLGALRTAAATALLIAAPALLEASSALAQNAQAIYAPDDPIVTGFSGVVPPETPPPSGDPLDQTFIDLDGASAVIQHLQADGPPNGQLIAADPVFSAKAKDIGQVFGVTLDDAQVPNIYVTASSAYGLNIVVPGSDGQPVRSKAGAPNATFMDGQWGAAGGAAGSPGSIWKIDGTTGEISLFTTIAANSGAGLGDIAFDASSQQFFVSDLDTGLVYRIGIDGTIIDTFDHGLTGRPTHELSPVADDNSEMDITTPSFNAEDPATWGFAQPERKVYGLAMHGGRLYYAVAAGPSIWSVGINSDGSFGDVRWELDVTGLPSKDEITGIVFDPEGRMILAQRGQQVASYDYTAFVTPKTSSVVRYTHEYPDDPSTPSTWVATPDSYAIGFRPDGANSSGGVALGYGYDAQTQAIGGACSAYLWSTGDVLREGAGDPPAEVAGLQGNDRSLVRPKNDPPQTSYFTDYDGATGDDQAMLAGHVGDVAIWQDCQGATASGSSGGGGYGYGGGYGWPVIPPGGHQPPGGNLTLTKWARPSDCKDIGGYSWCGFTIRVENTGSTPYWGPITVNDWLPGTPAGATMQFYFQPPWACSPTGPDAYSCVTGPALLYPGDSIDLHEMVKVPVPNGKDAICYVDNAAKLVWTFGQDDNPTDDFDTATAYIHSQDCDHTPPDHQKTNLRLTKTADPVCASDAIDWICTFTIKVSNTGPGLFSGGITVTDTLGTTVSASTPSAVWSCTQSGPTLTCSLNTPVANKPVGWTTGFHVIAKFKKATDGAPLCKLDNKADITSPPAGSAMNVFGGDDHGSASAIVPDIRCHSDGHTEIQISKKLIGCGVNDSPAGGPQGYACRWQVSIVNSGTGPYTGPLSFSDVSPQAIGNSLTTLPVCSGSATSVTCTSPGNVTLNPGVPVNVPVITTYPANGRICEVKNTATILQPVPGSAQNPTGPDSATATATLPNPNCGGTQGGGTPNLGLVKTFGSCTPYESAALATDVQTPSSNDEAALATNISVGKPYACTWTVKITNHGSADYTGPVEFVEKPGGGGKIKASPDVCGQPNGTGVYDCKLPTTTIVANGGSRTVTITEEVAVQAGQCTIDNTAVLAAQPGQLQLLPEPVTGQIPDCAQAEHHAPPPLCPIAQRAPKSDANPTGCCPDGTRWNGRICALPRTKLPPVIITPVPTGPLCPDDSHIVRGKCVCDPGTRGTPGNCRPVTGKPPIVVTPLPTGPLCPKDSHVVRGRCVCDPGTVGRPGNCEPIVVKPTGPLCPSDNHWNPRAKACICDRGTRGTPGKCRAPSDNGNNGNNPGTIDLPPRTLGPLCPKDSHIVRGRCVCNSGRGRPGECIVRINPDLFDNGGPQIDRGPRFVNPRLLNPGFGNPGLQFDNNGGRQLR